MSLSLNAQIIETKISNHKLELGFHINDYFISYKDPITFEKFYYLDLGLEPYITYYPTNNLGVGISFYYSFVKSDFIELVPLKAIGVYSRYYIPYKINKKVLNRFDFFVEIFLAKSNFKEDINQPVYNTKHFDVSSPYMYEKFSQTIIHAPILGVNFQLFKKLNAEVSVGYKIYIDGKEYFDPRVGLTYYLFNDDIKL